MSSLKGQKTTSWPIPGLRRCTLEADILKIDGIHTYHGQSHILRGLTFAVPRGRVLGLLGRSRAEQEHLHQHDHGIAEADGRKHQAR